MISLVGRQQQAATAAASRRRRQEHGSSRSHGRHDRKQSHKYRKATHQRDSSLDYSQSQSCEESNESIGSFTDDYDERHRSRSRRHHSKSGSTKNPNAPTSRARTTSSSRGRERRRHQKPNRSSSSGSSCSSRHDHKRKARKTKKSAKRPGARQPHMHRSVTPPRSRTRRPASNTASRNISRRATSSPPTITSGTASRDDFHSDGGTAPAAATPVWDSDYQQQEQQQQRLLWTAPQSSFPPSPYGCYPMTPSPWMTPPWMMMDPWQQQQWQQSQQIPQPSPLYSYPLHVAQAVHAESVILMEDDDQDDHNTSEHYEHDEHDEFHRQDLASMTRTTANTTVETAANAISQAAVVEEHELQSTNSNNRDDNDEFSQITGPPPPSPSRSFGITMPSDQPSSAINQQQVTNLPPKPPTAITMVTRRTVDAPITTATDDRSSSSESSSSSAAASDDDSSNDQQSATVQPPMVLQVLREAGYPVPSDTTNKKKQPPKQQRKPALQLPQQRYSWDDNAAFNVVHHLSRSSSRPLTPGLNFYLNPHGAWWSNRLRFFKIQQPNAALDQLPKLFLRGIISRRYTRIQTTVRKPRPRCYDVYDNLISPLVPLPRTYAQLLQDRASLRLGTDDESDVVIQHQKTEAIPRRETATRTTTMGPPPGNQEHVEVTFVNEVPQLPDRPPTEAFSSVRRQHELRKYQEQLRRQFKRQSVTDNHDFLREPTIIRHESAESLHDKEPTKREPQENGTQVRIHDGQGEPTLAVHHPYRRQSSFHREEPDDDQNVGEPQKPLRQNARTHEQFPSSASSSRSGLPPRHPELSTPSHAPSLPNNLDIPSLRPRQQTTQETTTPQPHQQQSQPPYYPASWHYPYAPSPFPWTPYSLPPAPAAPPSQHQGDSSQRTEAHSTLQYLPPPSPFSPFGAYFPPFHLPPWFFGGWPPSSYPPHTIEAAQSLPTSPAVASRDPPSAPHEQLHRAPPEILVRKNKRPRSSRTGEDPPVRTNPERLKESVVLVGRIAQQRAAMEPCATTKVESKNKPHSLPEAKAWEKESDGISSPTTKSALPLPIAIMPDQLFADAGVVNDELPVLEKLQQNTQLHRNMRLRGPTIVAAAIRPEEALDLHEESEGDFGIAQKVLHNSELHQKMRLRGRSIACGEDNYNIPFQDQESLALDAKSPATFSLPQEPVGVPLISNPDETPSAESSVVGPALVDSSDDGAAPGSSVDLMDHASVTERGSPTFYLDSGLDGDLGPMPLPTRIHADSTYSSDKAYAGLGMLEDPKSVTMSLPSQKKRFEDSSESSEVFSDAEFSVPSREQGYLVPPFLSIISVLFASSNLARQPNNASLFPGGASRAPFTGNDVQAARLCARAESTVHSGHQGPSRLVSEVDHSNHAAWKRETGKLKGNFMESTGAPQSARTVLPASDKVASSIFLGKEALSSRVHPTSSLQQTFQDSVRSFGSTRLNLRASRPGGAAFAVSSPNQPSPSPVRTSKKLNLHIVKLGAPAPPFAAEAEGKQADSDGKAILAKATTADVGALLVDQGISGVVIDDNGDVSSFTSMGELEDPFVGSVTSQRREESLLGTMDQRRSGDTSSVASRSLAPLGNQPEVTTEPQPVRPTVIETKLTLRRAIAGPATSDHDEESPVSPEIPVRTKRLHLTTTRLGDPSEPQPRQIQRVRHPTQPDMGQPVLQSTKLSFRNAGQSVDTGDARSSLSPVPTKKLNLTVTRLGETQPSDTSLTLQPTIEIADSMSLTQSIPHEHSEHKTGTESLPVSPAKSNRLNLTTTRIGAPSDLGSVGLKEDDVVASASSASSSQSLPPVRKGKLNLIVTRLGPAPSAPSPAMSDLEPTTSTPIEMEEEEEVDDSISSASSRSPPPPVRKATLNLTITRLGGPPPDPPEELVEASKPTHVGPHSTEMEEEVTESEVEEEIIESVVEEEVIESESISSSSTSQSPTPPIRKGKLQLTVTRLGAPPERPEQHEHRLPMCGVEPNERANERDSKIAVHNNSPRPKVRKGQLNVIMTRIGAAPASGLIVSEVGEDMVVEVDDGRSSSRSSSPASPPARTGRLNLAMTRVCSGNEDLVGSEAVEPMVEHYKGDIVLHDDADVAAETSADMHSLDASMKLANSPRDSLTKYIGSAENLGGTSGKSVSSSYSQGMDFSVSDVFANDVLAQAGETLQHPDRSGFSKADKISEQFEDYDGAYFALTNFIAMKKQPKLKQATLALIATLLLDAQEKKKLDEIFDAIDRDHDRRLSREDIRYGFAEFLGIKDLEEAEIEELFCRIGSEKTDFIDYTEFLIGATDKSAMLGSEALQRAFNMLDAGKTGFITAADLKKVLPSADKTINKIIAKVDFDGDGQISFGEFLSMVFKSANVEVSHVQGKDSAPGTPAVNTGSLQTEDPQLLSRTSDTWLVSQNVNKSSKIPPTIDASAAFTGKETVADKLQRNAKLHQKMRTRGPSIIGMARVDGRQKDEAVAHGEAVNNATKLLTKGDNSGQVRRGASEEDHQQVADRVLQKVQLHKKMRMRGPSVVDGVAAQNDRVEPIHLPSIKKQPRQERKPKPIPKNKLDEFERKEFDLLHKEQQQPKAIPQHILDEIHAAEREKDPELLAKLEAALHSGPPPATGFKKDGKYLTTRPDMKYWEEVTDEDLQAKPLPMNLLGELQMAQTDLSKVLHKGREHTPEVRLKVPAMPFLSELKQAQQDLTKVLTVVPEEEKNKKAIQKARPYVDELREAQATVLKTWREEIYNYWI